ncbi:hypothetical protein [Xenorhabdus siamensis]
MYREETETPVGMTVIVDTASEWAYLSTSVTLRNQLLFADAGYLDFDYFV